MVAACFFTLLATAAPSAFIVGADGVDHEDVAPPPCCCPGKVVGPSPPIGRLRRPVVDVGLQQQPRVRACSAVRLGPFLPKPPADRDRVFNEPCYTHSGICGGYPVCCVAAGTCPDTISSNADYYEGGCTSPLSSTGGFGAGCTKQGECVAPFLEVGMGGLPTAGIMAQLPQAHPPAGSIGTAPVSTSRPSTMRRGDLRHHPRHPRRQSPRRRLTCRRPRREIRSSRPRTTSPRRSPSTCRSSILLHAHPSSRQ